MDDNKKENPAVVKPGDNSDKHVVQLTPNEAVLIDIALTEEKAKRGIA
jgi:hypothetical protein